VNDWAGALVEWCWRGVGETPEILAKEIVLQSPTCTGLRQKPGVHREWPATNGIASKIGWFFFCYWVLNVLHKTCNYFRTELGNSSSNHCRTHVLLVLRDTHSIISLTACLSMAYMLSLFKNVLYTTHVYFVMSIVSAFTDPNVQTPHIPSSRSPVYSLLPSLFPKCQLKPQALCYIFLARYYLLRCVTRRLELGTLLVMKCGCGTRAIQ
jgi:hypothetical protein